MIITHSLSEKISFSLEEILRKRIVQRTKDHYLMIFILKEDDWRYYLMNYFLHHKPVDHCFRTISNHNECVCIHLNGISIKNNQRSRDTHDQIVDYLVRIEIEWSDEALVHLDHTKFVPIQLGYISHDWQLKYSNSLLTTAEIVHSIISASSRFTCCQYDIWVAATQTSWERPWSEIVICFPVLPEMEYVAIFSFSPNDMIRHMIE